MTHPPEDELAATMDCEPTLVPVLEQLFTDLDALSLPAGDLLALYPDEVPARVLDLGCGKGALGRALAGRGAEVLGVDGHAAFLHEAEARVTAAGLADRCRYVAGDIRTPTAWGTGWPAVLWLGLGELIGPLDETLAALRPVLAAGGEVVLDDAHLRDADEGLADLGVQTEDEMRATIDAAGFDLVTMRRLDTPAHFAWWTAAGQQVAERAEALCAARPDLAGALRAFAARHREEMHGDDLTVTGVLLRLRAR